MQEKFGQIFDFEENFQGRRSYRQGTHRLPGHSAGYVHDFSYQYCFVRVQSDKLRIAIINDLNNVNESKLEQPKLTQTTGISAPNENLKRSTAAIEYTLKSQTDKKLCHCVNQYRIAVKVLPLTYCTLVWLLTNQHSLITAH